MSKIEFRNINKSFGENKVINNFSIKIDSGEFVVLVGPSGCGKSTLLRMVSGLETIDQGQILLNDKILNDLIPSKREIAMVFQSYALYPHMNVYENMSFGLKMENKNKNYIDEKVKEAAKMLQIEDLLERKPKELSGGQKQRVAIGRAITRNPKIFLFDEPLSNLDAALRVHMRSELSELHNSLKTTFVYVTHDQAEALTMSSRMAVMIDGNLLQLDTPQEVYDNPSSLSVAQFVGSPKINIFKGSSDSSGTVSLLNLTLKRKSSESNLELNIGIRPEHLEITNQSDENTFSATVSYRENLGSDIFFHVNTEDGMNRIIVRGIPQLTHEISSGSKVNIRRVSNKALLFNKEGKRVQFNNA